MIAGFAGVVEVVQGKVEELNLVAQVDILVSEPMGTLLVNERMLETYLYARDRYLKQGGRMFPVSKASCTSPLACSMPNMLCVQSVQSWRNHTSVLAKPALWVALRSVNAQPSEVITTSSCLLITWSCQQTSLLHQS